MPAGTNWYSWFSMPFFAPLSGAVTQDINPEPYAGSIEIENAVTREAASFGRQLGKLTEAVLELAQHLERPAGLPTLAAHASGAASGSAIAELKTLSGQIAEIKALHRQSAEQEVTRALERLRTVDPDGHAAFLARCRS